MRQFIINIKGEKTDKVAIVEWDGDTVREVWCARCFQTGRVPMQDNTYHYETVTYERLVELMLFGFEGDCGIGCSNCHKSI